jgi:hypothetical protein
LDDAHRHRHSVIPHLRERSIYRIRKPSYQPYQRCADGDIGEVEMLVQSAAVLARTSSILIRVTMISERLLHLAAGEGHSTLSFLCEAGAEVNVEDRWLRRPLMMPTWEVTNHAPRY